MTRGGRLITLISLVLIALWLHISLCAWRFPTNGSTPDTPLFALGEWYREAHGWMFPEVVSSRVQA